MQYLLYVLDSTLLQHSVCIRQLQVQHFVKILLFQASSVAIFRAISGVLNTHPSFSNICGEK